MEGRSVLDWAQEYLAKGYSVIPIKAGEKKPQIKWQEYQSRKASLDEVTSWFYPRSSVALPPSNIALVTGRISGLTVVDIDPRHGGLDSARELGLGGWTVVTGGGGFHLYCRYNMVTACNSAGRLPGLDIRSEGGYVLAPPSVTTGMYSFISSDIPRNTDLSPVPERVKQALSLRGVNKSTDFTTVSSKAGTIFRTPILFDSASTGSRNVVCATMAGRILRRHNPTYERGLDVLRLWNAASCRPPLDDGELIQTYQSIWEKHNRKNQG